MHGWKKSHGVQAARKWRLARAHGGPGLSADQLAKPFALFRRLFSGEPDQVLIRRLMLAGYRNVSYADIFLGARLAIPVFLGIVVALLISDNVIFFFLIALVLGFFIPDLWLGYAINKRREIIRLSLPGWLGPAVDLHGSRPGTGSSHRQGRAGTPGEPSRTERRTAAG